MLLHVFQSTVKGSYDLETLFNKIGQSRCVFFSAFQSTRGPTCLSCKNSPAPAVCNIISVCNKDEVIDKQ